MLNRRPKELPLFQDLDGDDELRALLPGKIHSTKLAAAQLPADVKVVQRPHTVRVGGLARGSTVGGLLKVIMTANATVTAAAAGGAGGVGVHRHVFWWGEGVGWGQGSERRVEGIDAKENPARRSLNKAQPLINSGSAHTFVFDRHFA